MWITSENLSTISADERVPLPVSTDPKSTPAEPMVLIQLLRDTTSHIELNRGLKVPELWVGEKEVWLGNGVYKWVCWKDGADVIRTRMGSGGNEILNKYRKQRWPRRFQRWIACSFNKRSGHKPWERTQFTNLLTEIETSLDLDIDEKSNVFISEVEIPRTPAKTNVFWGSRINRDCTLLRLETIEALKMYCQHDYDGFMGTVHRYKTVITNDLCANTNSGPIFTAEMAKDAMQNLAATSWAAPVPHETIQYVRDIIQHHLSNPRI